MEITTAWEQNSSPWCRCALGGLAVLVEQGHGGALGGQGVGGCLSDAAAGPGDDGEAVFQVHGITL